MADRIQRRKSRLGLFSTLSIALSTGGARLGVRPRETVALTTFFGFTVALAIGFNPMLSTPLILALVLQRLGRYREILSGQVNDDSDVSKLNQLTKQPIVIFHTLSNLGLFVSFATIGALATSPQLTDAVNLATANFESVVITSFIGSTIATFAAEVLAHDPLWDITEVIRQAERETTASQSTNEHTEQISAAELEDFRKIFEEQYFCEIRLSGVSTKELDEARHKVKAARNDQWIQLIRPNGRPLLSRSVANELNIEPKPDFGYGYLTKPEALTVLQRYLESPLAANTDTGPLNSVRPRPSLRKGSGPDVANPQATTRSAIRIGTPYGI